MKSCVTISLVEAARGGPFVFWDGLDAGCRQAAELGFDAVEIFPPGAEGLEVTSLRRRLDDHGLQLAAIGSGAGWVTRQLSLTAAKAEQRDSAVDYITRLLQVAAEFQAAVIVGSMQGRWSETVDRATALTYLREAFDRLGALAERLGVTLLYEPLNRYETNLCNTLAAGCDLLDSLSTDNVRLLADLFHMNIEEVDLGDALRQAGTRVGHVHFVDSNRQAVGCGHLDIGPIIEALRGIGYAGYLSAEVLPLPDSTTAAATTIRSFRYWNSLRDDE